MSRVDSCGRCTNAGLIEIAIHGHNPTRPPLLVMARCECSRGQLCHSQAVAAEDAAAKAKPPFLPPFAALFAEAMRQKPGVRKVIIAPTDAERQPGCQPRQLSREAERRLAATLDDIREAHGRAPHPAAQCDDWEEEPRW